MEAARARDLGVVAGWSALTLGFYRFWWVPALGRDVNACLGEPRFDPKKIAIVGVLTLGIGLSVAECRYAYALERRGQAPEGLGGKVVALNLLAWALSLLSGGLGAVLGLAAGLWATWLVQAEVNRHAPRP
jgi:hypothetical protein